MVRFNQKLVVASATIALVTLTGGYKSPVFANTTPKATVAAAPSKTGFIPNRRV